MQPSDVEIVILDDHEGAALHSAYWEALGESAVVSATPPGPHSEEALVEMLKGAHVVIVMRERTQFDRSLVTRLAQLRLIVTTGAENSAIDLEACRELGIFVAGTRSTRTPVVELAWAHILAASRSLVLHGTSMRAGEWLPRLGLDIEGATLGIVGLGRTGSRMATIGAAFGMKVIAWSPHLTPERAAHHQATYVPKTVLFSQSDFVSLHLKLSKDTRDIVGREDLALMPKHAWLVNTSRSDLVDQCALREALEEGSIAGAALDVFHQEPLDPDDPWRSMPNVQLTPHRGYVTAGTFADWYQEAVVAIQAFLSGREIPHRLA